MLTGTYNTIGQRVKAYRKHLGLSQDELAEGICSRQTISILENDQHIPSADILQHIAVRLGLPLHEIMKGHVRGMETKVQIEILKVYIETADYGSAMPIIEELEIREDLLEHQRREIVLSKSECLMRTGKADQAVDLLEDLQQRLEMERESNDHLMAIVYDKLGTANYFLSNITNAYANYMRAYQLTFRFPKFDYTAARIVFNLGLICRHLNRHAEAIQYLSMAEAFFKNESDLKRLAQTLFALGLAFRFDGDFERAEQYLQESLALYKSQNILRLARLVKESYAFTVLSRKKPELAIQEMIECAEEFEREGDVTNLAYTYARIAKLFLEQQNSNGAWEYLDKALKMIPMQETIKQPKIVTVFQIYAEYLLVNKEFDKCIQYAFKSSQLFDKIGCVTDAADSLSPAIQAFRKQGDLGKALETSEQMCKLLRLSKSQLS